MMNTTIEWQKDIHFQAKTSEGHSVDIDGAKEFGGSNSGVRPMEMVLSALATCLAIDFVLMLKKARVELTALQIHAEATRSDTVPKVFTEIHLQFAIQAKGLRAAQASKFLNLALDKYCSVASMLRPKVQISVSHNITDDDG